MSRFQSLTSLQVTGAAVPSVITRFLESADAASLEEQFETLQSGLVAGGYFLSHIDLAGGGDGHTFVLHTQWAIPGGAVTFANGGDPSNFVLFLYQAAQAAALAVAKAACQARIAELFTAQVATLIEVDTYLAGAQMGTRYMGGIMTTRTFEA